MLMRDYGTIKGNKGGYHAPAATAGRIYASRGDRCHRYRYYIGRLAYREPMAWLDSALQANNHLFLSIL